MNFAEGYAKHLRLTLLRVLAVAPGYAANSSILHEMACEMGVTSTRDQVRTELAWLEEQQLVRLTHPSPTLAVATLSDRGFDVQAGRASVPGVQRPSPGL